MRCKQSLVLLLSAAILVSSTIAHVVTGHTPESAQSPSRNRVAVHQCLSDSEVSETVTTLSSGQYDNQQRAVAFLKVNAKRSATCRQQVITKLLTAMDQPNLDLTGGTRQFYLWHYGARLLAELKAVEALDLLIANFDLHDGSGFPLDHHPALVAVCDMGEIALPKLRAVLRESHDPNTRQYAVFCIAQIGGPLARQILREALPGESDKCTASCIRATLTSFRNKRRPNNISDEGRTDWYTTFLCKDL